MLPHHYNKAVKFQTLVLAVDPFLPARYPVHNAVGIMPKGKKKFADFCHLSKSVFHCVTLGIMRTVSCEDIWASACAPTCWQTKNTG